MTDLQRQITHLLEATSALNACLAAADFDPAAVSQWLPLVEAAIAAWRNLDETLDGGAQADEWRYALARAIRYGEQPPTRELARLLQSIPPGEFDIE